MDEEKKDKLEEKVENQEEKAEEVKTEETVDQSKVEETALEENKESAETISEENKKEEVSEESKENSLNENNEEIEAEETLNGDSKTEEYVPEQLDDDDFEKEKEKEKADKKAKKEAKKLAKKEEKTNGVSDEENGQAVNKKISSPKMILIIVLILASIGVILAYFAINFNKPENVANDFIIYFNKGEWKNAEETIDWQGFLTLALIDDEAQTDTEEDTDNESQVAVANYMDYDSRYETIYKDLEDKGLNEIVDYIEEARSNVETIMGATLEGSTIKIDKISSVEKIEKTKSLYKIKADITVTGGEQKQSNTVEMYVAKKDGKFKLVGGYLPTLVYQTFIYYQYLSANY